MLKSLENELHCVNIKLVSQELKIENLKLKGAMYKAFFFHMWDLGERLKIQIAENSYACIGEFDGFCYSSKRGNAKYRTLENLMNDGIITKIEYNECNQL